MNATDPISDLVAQPDPDRRWDALSALVKASPAAAAAAALASLNADAERREVSADVLGQVACADSSRASGIAAALCARLGVESEPDVIESLVIALGHAGDHRTVASARAAVLRFVRHPDADVRQAVAFALAGPELDEEALGALRALSADPDDDVRDWATFGLAESDADDPESIAALAARSDDPHDDTRAEAIFGLAKRRDPRARALCERELTLPSHGSLIEDALALLD